jgi:hypothetical protein
MKRVARVILQGTASRGSNGCGRVAGTASCASSPQLHLLQQHQRQPHVLSTISSFSSSSSSSSSPSSSSSGTNINTHVRDSGLTGLGDFSDPLSGTQTAEAAEKLKAIADFRKAAEALASPAERKEAARYLPLPSLQCFINDSVFCHILIWLLW